MASASVSRWARRSMVASAAFLVAWQAAAVAGLPRRTLVALALPGFVYHAVFGKATALVPSYFDTQLAFPRAGALTLPLTAVGALALATGPALDGGWLLPLGAGAWAVGAVGVLAALAWTVRDNPTGAATGTGDHNAARRRVDRLANAAVPVVGLYVLAGAYEQFAVLSAAPSLLGRGPAGASHLLAAGGATLLVFAVGFRLFPRFLVARPPLPLVVVVLAAGAVGPVLVAGNLYGGLLFRAGAVLEAAAVVGFAAAYATLFVRSERRRVGFYSVLVAALAGTVGVLLGVQFAFAGTAGLANAHYRLNLLGFLGLTILGAAYQFYPPTVGDWPGADDRTAAASVALVGVGLVLDVAGAALSLPPALGPAVALGGALLYAALLVGALAARR